MISLQKLRVPAKGWNTMLHMSVQDTVTNQSEKGEKANEIYRQKNEIHAPLYDADCGYGIEYSWMRQKK